MGTLKVTRNDAASQKILARMLERFRAIKRDIAAITRDLEVRLAHEQEEGDDEHDAVSLPCSKCTTFRGLPSDSFFFYCSSASLCWKTDGEAPCAVDLTTGEVFTPPDTGAVVPIHLPRRAWHVLRAVARHHFYQRPGNSQRHPDALHY